MKPNTNKELQMLQMLYLETAELPNKSVISVRRLMYLHTILRRNTEELTSKLYMAMKNNPGKGDWTEKIAEDLKYIGMDLEMENTIKEMSKNEFKKIVKQGVRNNTFTQLVELNFPMIK